MRTAIAASFAAVIGSFAILTLRQPVSAAEQLQRSVQAQSAYKGWVHISRSFPRGSKDDVRTIRHVNTADGTIVEESIQPDHHAISFSSLATKLEHVWIKEVNEIRIQDLTEREIADLREGSDPLTMNDAIKGLRLVLDSASPNVVEAMDETLQRFEVTRGDKRSASVPRTVKITVWIDPATKLIARMLREVRESADDTNGKARAADIEHVYSYGDPAFKDIYSAGASRDAAVVDMRPDAPTAELLAKLRPFLMPPRSTLGDYVGVLTQSGTKSGEPIKAGSVMVIGRRGDAWFRREFHVNGKTGFPKGWPMPSAEDAMVAAMSSPPRRIAIGDAERTTTWEYERAGQPPRVENGGSIPGSIIAYPFSMAWEFLDASTNRRRTLIRSNLTHPGLIGLRTQTFFSGTAMAKPDPDQDPGEVLWIDPARGNVPVAWDRHASVIDLQDKQRWYKQTTTFSEFAKLANGTPYPTKWSHPSEIPGMPRRPSDKSDPYTVEYRLHIDQRPPGEAWFKPPAEEK